ncbi:MAG TPA: class I SAM-dependent methyltransferase, partial [Desulfobacterales bacterium]|nr:class I SAM-dependent methyltransferase [Desulfobacterales bacterium]
MLDLTRQERIRSRYRDTRPGYRTAREVYAGILSRLVHRDIILLDAGCGQAGLVEGYCGLAHMVVGVDKCLRRFRESIKVKDLVEGGLEALPFPNEVFSLITCSWVLEHLENPIAVLIEITRVLRPGGHFLFLTPNALNYTIWLSRLIPNTMRQRMVREIYGREETFTFPAFYRANTHRWLDKTLTRLGYECEVFEYVGDPSYIAFNEFLFRLAVMFEKVTDKVWPQGKVHMVG